MQLNMKEFVETVLASPRRYVMPIMTSPGMELIGAKPVDVFRDGELQFRCIDALAKATGAAQYTADLVVHRRDVLHANHFLLILIRLKEKMKNGD